MDMSDHIVDLFCEEEIMAHLYQSSRKRKNKGTVYKDLSRIYRHKKLKQSKRNNQRAMKNTYNILDII